MKKVLVVGCHGNMGGRYTAILDYLCIPWDGIDIGDPVNYIKYDGIILATPTDSHSEDIFNYCDTHRDTPILCEKPLCKDIDELKRVLALPGLNLRMVNQYAYMPGADEADAKGNTYYNYFKTGKDGLAWDCINIIGMSKGEVRLKNDSPIWDCWVNGKNLNLADMDYAYIDMIEGWIKNPTNNHEYILNAHEKVITWMGSST